MTYAYLANKKTQPRS